MRPHLSHVLLAGLFLAGTAQAADTAPTARAPATPADTASLQIPGLGSALRAERLASLRGGANSVDNLVDIDGTVANNQANYVVTGDNAISEGTFANAAGISTVIQNSGNNVLIQNGMVVNIQFLAPGP